MTPKWITTKDLGVIADGSFFEKQLRADNPGYTVNYRLISGRLPRGIELTHNGLLTGVPTVMDSLNGELNRQASFTIRAENNIGRLADRTFTLLVSGVQAPTIISSTTNLGMYYDGDYFSYQLQALDDHPGSKLTWKYVRGRIPPGITINSTGLLQGFFYQNKLKEIDYLKIDTEGHEFFVLKGFDKYIKNVKVIHFEHHYDSMLIKKYKFSDIHNLLIKNNFYNSFKIKMFFRKSFEYIYLNNNFFKI